MGIYKFCENRWLKSTLGGRFSFGRLAYYRLLEQVFGTPFIGDRLEGATVVNSGHFATPLRPADLEALRRVGLVLQGLDNVVVRNSTLQSNIDCFVLSLAQGELPALEHVFGGNLGYSSGYNCSIEILDLNIFIHRLGETSFRGKPVKEQFVLHYGPVEYRDVEFLASDGEPPPPSVFVKRPFFKEQSEFRIALFPKDPIEKDRLIIDIDLPEGVLIERSCGPDSEPVGELTADEAEQRISAAVEWYEKLPRCDIGDYLSQYGDDRKLAYQMCGKAQSECDERAEMEFSSVYRQSVLEAYWELRKVRPHRYLDMICNSGIRFSNLGMFQLYLQHALPD
jgi:hypothetical protein